MNQQKIYKNIAIIVLLTLVCFLMDTTQANANNNSNDYIFVGDSRTVHLGRYADTSELDSCYFIAKSGKGYDWLSYSAVSQIQSILDRYPSKTFHIIFNFGVNDLKNYNKYIALYKSLAKRWSKHNLYIVSVNPVIEEIMGEYGYHLRTNSGIEKFNRELEMALKDKYNYLNTYDALRFEIGYSMTDGLHYSQDTYKTIFSLVIEAIRGY